MIAPARTTHHSDDKEPLPMWGRLLVLYGFDRSYAQSGR